MKMTKAKKKKRSKLHQVNIRHIILSKESRKALKKFKSHLNDPVVWSIEDGNWWVPTDTYEFIDNKLSLEKSFHEFFDIPEDVLIEIDAYDSDIMAFEKGIHPKYHK